MIKASLANLFHEMSDVSLLGKYIYSILKCVLAKRRLLDVAAVTSGSLTQSAR